VRRAAVERLAATLLYEGYVLYPYRRSSVKNQQRFNFGGVYPRAFAEANGGGDPWAMQTEVLVAGARARLSIVVRFLHLIDRAGWQEAEERAIELDGVGEHPFAVGGRDDGTQDALIGRILVEEHEATAACKRLRVRIENLTPMPAGDGRAAALRRSLASTHTLLFVDGGDFVSLLEPPPALEAAALACKNVGTWPVLVGARGERDAMLSSPIIVYDYPEVAPESPGDLFDACEIDEILTLRILTLTDAEKAEVRASDPRAAALLDRTDALDAAALGRLHGAIRELRPVAAGALRSGDRVRLCPRGRADAFDVVLAGRLATIAAVEQDFEGRVQYAVTIDDDPGADLGAHGFPGHRFFFAADEVERP